jgi:hypothetical protein
LCSEKEDEEEEDDLKKTKQQHGGVCCWNLLHQVWREFLFFHCFSVFVSALIVVSSSYQFLGRNPG